MKYNTPDESARQRVMKQAYKWYAEQGYDVQKLLSLVNARKKERKLNL